MNFINFFIYGGAIVQILTIVIIFILPVIGIVIIVKILFVNLISNSRDTTQLRTGHELKVDKFDDEFEHGHECEYPEEHESIYSKHCCDYPEEHEMDVREWKRLQKELKLKDLPGRYYGK